MNLRLCTLYGRQNTSLFTFGCFYVLLCNIHRRIFMHALFHYKFIIKHMFVRSVEETLKCNSFRKDNVHITIMYVYAIHHFICILSFSRLNI
jgi:hypothetical protein